MLTRGAHSIHARNLSKHYGRVRAVDDVSLTVKRGEFVTLLGPSGSGKTTILMAIAGFVEPTAGEILVDDRVITHLPPESRRFGMVFQGYALFPHLSVADNVAFPLRARKVPKAEAAKQVRGALDLVQLGELADRMPRQLSGGQQQRVALARALVFEPDVLLLDEPLSALDKKLRAELQWELKSLHSRVGMTFIYVTHDQEEALSMSDEVAVLRNGKLVQLAAPRVLYDSPRTRFVADFLGKSNFLAGTIAGADGGLVRYRVGPHLFAQTGSEPGALGRPALIALRPEKIAISAVEPEGTPNRVAGTVHSWSYFGTGIHFLVQVEGMGLLTVTRASWRSDIPLEAGQPVWLAWDPDASQEVIDDGDA